MHLALPRLLATGLHVLGMAGRQRGLAGAALARARAKRVRASMKYLCQLHGFEARVDGEWPRGPAIIAVNHLSYVDIPILLSALEAVPLAKAEIAGWPILGARAHKLGVLFVRRGDAHSGAIALRCALRALEQGLPVLGFPEGTTTDGFSPPLPYHRGLFGVAQIAGVPVIPVALRYPTPELAWHGDAYLLPHYLRTANRPRTVVDVRIGAALDARAYARAEELARVARAATVNLLGGQNHEPSSGERRGISTPRPDALLSSPVPRSRVA